MRATNVDREETWLWGWDESPGIVSVHAELDGSAVVYRRVAGSLIVERERFRPFVVLASLDDLEGASARVSIEELEGPFELRFLVRADDGRWLRDTLLRGASRRLGRRVSSLRELEDAVLVLPPEEQYLVDTGRTYFRGLEFDEVHRMHVDLETTGLDAARDRIFLAAIRAHDGTTETIEAASSSDADEAALISRLAARVVELDPDVIENHNLHGFDLPFLVERARRLRVPLRLGRDPSPFPRTRGSRRGTTVGSGDDASRRIRYTVGGREMLDTMDAVLRHDFAARDLPGHGLKVVARHLGLAADDREQIPGSRVYEVFCRDPERVRRYATSDVEEAAGLGRMMGGASFALAKMAPRRYERLADAGPATGVLDPLLVRAYLRERFALPIHRPSDGTPHSGAALHLFAVGVAHRIVKADVASLYPSLMRQYRIGPSRDRLGALLAIVDRLTTLRLEAKSRSREPRRSPAERHADESLAAAMKIVVNSAYGYLGASSLTRFADVHAANEVTRRGRHTLALLCRAFAERGMTLLEADTDGVYFSVPEGVDEARERAIVNEVAALLPPLVKLEFDGRYASMLSHEPKNYALLDYGGRIHLRGVAFRSRRIEPFAERFLRASIELLLRGDLFGVRRVYVETLRSIADRSISTHDVSALVRLSKSRDQYESGKQRELPYEAMLGDGRSSWRVGERVRVYRRASGRPGLLRAIESDEDQTTFEDPRDYDATYYANLITRIYAPRFARSLDPRDYDVVFSNPAQPSLFERTLEGARPRLVQLADPLDPDWRRIHESS